MDNQIEPIAKQKPKVDKTPKEDAILDERAEAMRLMGLKDEKPRK